MREFIPEYVLNLLKTLESAGYEAWCVGGCVRDTLLGRTPGDWDVTTNALPEETMAVFGDSALPTGLQHGTVSVRTPGGTVEVTTYRLDGTYTDHRRPDSVTFTPSLEEDLRRRDFTVNAMAMNLRGDLRDPFGGRTDLENRCLRCVGEAEQRFREDALRILRGLRFASVLGFAIEPETAAAIHRHRGLLADIAAERIWVELLKLLEGEACVAVLREFVDVLGVFWPEVLPMVGMDQKNYHHCYDVWEHTLHAVDAVKVDSLLRCVALLHDIGKTKTMTLDADGVGHFYGHPAKSEELAEGMLRRLKCSNAFRERALRLIAWHDRELWPTGKSLSRALRVLGEEDLRNLLDIKRADNRGQAEAFWGYQRDIDELEAALDALLAEEVCFSLKQLAVNGRDMMALGLEGAAVGEALNALLEAVLDGTLPNEKTALLAAAEGMKG